jgi:uncharacterized protein (DUF1800 family)
LLGVADVESGEQAVDVVLKNPHAPEFIVRKLFRFFIADEPTAPLELIRPLANQLRDEQWQISGVVRKMLGSQLMFSNSIRGRKIRSPIEWGMCWLKNGDASTNLKKLSEGLSELGQSVFFPPNVKGWDGGRAWINSSTLVGRTNLISSIIRDESTRWAGGDLNALMRTQRVDSVANLVDWIETRLLAIPLAKASRDRLIGAMETAGGVKRLPDCLVLASALPEMQLA